MRNDLIHGGSTPPRAEATDKTERRSGLAAELPSAILSAAMVVGTALLLRSCLLAGPIVDMRL